MKSRQRILACGVFAMVAAAGCGDSDNAQELSSLSDGETVQLCTKTAMALNNLFTTPELKRITCAGAAVTKLAEDADGDVDSGDIPACKQLSSECESSDDISEEDLVLDLVEENDCDGATTSRTFGDCRATVADYDRCAGRLMNELRTRFRSLTCDVLNDIDQLDEKLNGSVDVSDAPECRALKTKCPDISLNLEASDSEG